MFKKLCNILCSFIIFAWAAFIFNYWVENPSMTEMQVFLTFWKDWAIICLLAFAFGFIENIFEK